MRRTFWHVAGGAILALVCVAGVTHWLASAAGEWPYPPGRLPPDSAGPSKERPLVPGSVLWYGQVVGVPVALLGGGLAGWLLSRRSGRHGPC